MSSYYNRFSDIGRYADMEAPYKLVRPATSSLVAVEDLKHQLNLGTDDSFDEILEIQLMSAQDIAAKELGEFVATTRLSVTYDEFYQRLELPHRLVQRVREVNYYATDEEEAISVDEEDYIFDRTGNFPAVALKTTSVWPSNVSTNHGFPVEIVYDAGYQNTSELPESIYMAILLIGADLFKNRESTSDVRLYDTPVAARRLLAPFRRHA